MKGKKAEGEEELSKEKSLGKGEGKVRMEEGRR